MQYSRAWRTGSDLTSDLLFRVDQHGAKRIEDRACGVDGVRRRTETDAERKAGFLAGLGGLQKGLERPSIRLGRAAGGVHGLNVDARVLLHEIDARHRALHLAADGGGHADPLTLNLA